MVAVDGHHHQQVVRRVVPLSPAAAVEPHDTSGIEHDSILAAARNRHATGGGRLEIVDAGEDGVVDADAVATCILKGSRLGRTLLSVQAANNETGVIQPVAEIAQLAREHGIVVHTDAVQAAGRTVISFDDLGVDAMSLSAHKLGGPKGVGALVVRDRMALSPLIAGGQERRRRGGTENVIGIAGFGAAAAEAGG